MELLHNKSELYICPACGSNVTKNCGMLPPFVSQQFGGVPIHDVLLPGHLIHCLDCDLYFRYPGIPQSKLDSFYQGLPSNVWPVEKPRHYWPFLLKLLERYSADKTILDVGCYQGDFLSWMPKDWQKFGIEPGSAARALAINKGIQIVSNTVAEYQGSSLFGAITMIDFLEHTVSPLKAIKRLTKFLKPNGCMLILTGATDSIPWRFSKPHYWYSALPEHMTFFSKRWFEHASRELNLTVPFIHYLPSVHVSMLESLKEPLRFISYLLVQRLRERRISEKLLQKIPFIRSVAKWNSPPWWMSAKDHFIVVLKSKA